jgi:hypothetical protein
MINTGPRGGCLFMVGLGLFTIGAAALFAFVLFIDYVPRAYGAELSVPVIDGPIDKFGRYGDRYYQRRWKRMCAGPARYDAMREANDLGKRNPC